MNAAASDGTPRCGLRDYTLLKPSYPAVSQRGPESWVLRRTDDFHVWMWTGSIHFWFSRGKSSKKISYSMLPLCQPCPLWGGGGACDSIVLPVCLIPGYT